MTMQSPGRSRRGAVLIIFTLALVVIFGFMGLAFDVGRLYLVRNEAQSFCDAAALAAASMLDGTTPAKALDAVDGIYLTAGTNVWKRYHFQNTNFSGYRVRFSTTGQDGSFVELARTADAAHYRFVEVTATGNIPMYLSPILTGNSTGTAGTRAVGAQVLKTLWDEGLAPFAPKAHCSDTGLWGLTLACADSTYMGLTPCPWEYTATGGGCTRSTYTLRWDPNSWPQSFKNYPAGPVITTDWCSGDVYDLTDPTGSNLQNALASWYTSGEHWVDATGFFTTGNVHGASDYRTLINGSQGAPVDINQVLPGFDGQEPQQVSTIKDTLNAKAALPYPQNMIYVPLIDPISGIIIGYGSFELLPNNAYGPNNNWCAVYRPPCTAGLCGGQVEQDGIYEIRLVR